MTDAVERMNALQRAIEDRKQSMARLELEKEQLAKQATELRDQLQAAGVDPTKLVEARVEAEKQLLEQLDALEKDMYGNPVA